MKRDMDLIRIILLELEKREDAIGEQPLRGFAIAGRTRQEVGYHLSLAKDAGLVLCDTAHRGFERGAFPAVPSFPYPVVRRLTWQGHEFIDAFRDDTIWQRVKVGVVKHAGALTFEGLKAAAAAIASTAGTHVGQMFNP